MEKKLKRIKPAHKGDGHQGAGRFLNHPLFQPASMLEAYEETNRPAYPVYEHAEPYAVQRKICSVGEMVKNPL